MTTTTNISLGAEHVMEKMSPLADAGTKVSLAIHNAILAGGEPTRKIADFLHGTWLGHPLHPVLTDLTIGAWAMCGIFDAAGAIADDEGFRQTADHCAFAGTISALPTAVTGAVDYSTFPEHSATPATLHAMLNSINFGLWAMSVYERQRGNRGRGVLYSTLAIGLTCVSAWLGGMLVYKHKVGVDHSDLFDKPQGWTPILSASALHQRRPVRAEYDGKPILLYRDRDKVCAIGATCSHDGGPLNEGKFQDGCVQCPWHDSVFDLQTGDIVHGPATQPQPAFEARIRDGQVEIRLMHK